METFINVLIGVGSFTLFFVVSWIVFGILLKGGKMGRQIEREFIREYLTILHAGQHAPQTSQFTVTSRSICET